MKSYKLKARPYQTKLSAGFRSGSAFKSVSAKAKKALVKEAKDVFGKHYTPERLATFVSKAAEATARGRSQTARRVIDLLAVPLHVGVAEGVMRLLPPPIAGVASSDKKSLPNITSLNTSLISGKNSLYNAKEHKLKFTSGREPGSWLRSIEKLNGSHTIQVNNTTEQYPLVDTDRAYLVKNYGLNQKMQLAVNTERFGFTFSSLLDYFSIGTYDTNKIRTQVAYGAISKLTSKATITSMNRYVPVFVKVSLCRVETAINHFEGAFQEGINSTNIQQIDGAMPLFYQQENNQAGTLLGESISVDPKTPGVRASEKFKAAVQVLESKTVKLYAGDRIKLQYDHLCGSGVRLDKLHGVDRDSSWNNDHPITYSLMIESWGEEVDAYLYSNPDHVIKGTAPGSLQFEFSKHVTGIAPLKTGAEQQNTGANDGYFSNRYAVKVYTKSPLTSQVRRYFGTYADLTTTTANGYRIPVMSDATVGEAGKVNT